MYGQWNLKQGNKIVFRATLKSCELTDQNKSLSLEAGEQLWEVILIMVLTL